VGFTPLRINPNYLKWYAEQRQHQSNLVAITGQMIVVERHHRELGLPERLADFPFAAGIIETDILEQAVIQIGQLAALTAALRPNLQGGQQLNHRAGAACPSGGKNEFAHLNSPNLRFESKRGM
jgi:hypothetical protein